MAKYHKRAVFIGEETGGGYYGNTSGATTILKLPETGIKIYIPLIKYVSAVSDYPNGRGIIPDHHVEASIKEILEGQDPVMEYTLELIRQER